ncbi:hypothetical protein SD70_27190 [Gordoniibacillus kamchatkensis]|uniref:Uncharacterized protein n=1 Tax=Gordoniibacillus kamchatkensis TaxID=1590651 RepID=A0ABR5ABU0_9BACL|nr:hypothetical protein [Paenibacillus sp. VKM B-2647]KIL38303.1 hypothetical protein SD70_27190 [Paenibacillus sp. VKM B-2647]
MVLGDVYDIASRVKEFDPSYELSWNPRLKQYQVLANKRVLKKEGVLDGRPLHFMHDVREVVFTWDVKDMAPDMRIMWKLYETDTWRHPRGPLGYLEDLERETELARQKREERISEETDYLARENHSLVFEKKKSFDMGKAW